MVHLDGMTPTAKEIIQSYRQLYRHGLQAVQYSSPARHTLKDRLRRAYRNGTAADFDAEKIENTIQFLSNAAKEKGMEHRIVKNLLHAWWWERYLRFVNHSAAQAFGVLISAQLLSPEARNLSNP